MNGGRQSWKRASESALESTDPRGLRSPLGMPDGGEGYKTDKHDGSLPNRFGAQVCPGRGREAGSL